MSKNPETATPSGKQENRRALAIRRSVGSKLIQNLLMKLPPVNLIPLWLHYSSIIAIVLFFFILRLSLQSVIPFSPYLLLLPSVVLSALFLDRKAGCLAVLLSGLLAYYFFVVPYNSFTGKNPASLIALGTYFIIGFFIALIVEALRETMDELGEAVHELELTNKKLHESNKQLDDFAHIISHDLKEPVRGIDTYCSLLLEDCKEKLNPEEQEKISKVKSMCWRLNEMISDLLKYSRVDKESDGPEEAADLDDVINSVLDLLRPQIEKDAVQFSVARPLPKINCSRVHMAEIFRNLVTNGIKYNTSHPKKIEIGFTEDHPKHPRAHTFFVKDNGIGIPPELRETVFKMFKRLHGREQYGGGTGAGLAIVKKLVEQHDGQIWIEANEGGGSIFYFYLECG